MLLDIIAAYESGLADAIRKKHDEYGRILTINETEDLFHECENMALWKALIQRGRAKMASRDRADLRIVILSVYICKKGARGLLSAVFRASVGV